MMVSSHSDSLPDTMSLDKPANRNEAGNDVSALSDSDSQMLQSENIDQNLEKMESLSFDKNGNERQQDKEKIQPDKDVESYVEANFWCGECEQMYNIECPQHRMQEMSDRAIKTRGWSALPNQTLASDIEDCINCNDETSQDCAHFRIQAICDKPVKTRAWASLPAQHLAIRKIPFSDEHGVFVRKAIPKRTRFGPLEGMLVDSADIVDNKLNNFTLYKDGTLLLLDTSDEDFSNWMRFVRKATTYLEENCVVVQIEGSLYFLTSADISPRTELRVGYSKQYADKRNLKTLEPTEEEIHILDGMRKSWPCYECDEAFETSAELQQHLVCHDGEDNEDDKKKRRRVKNRRPRGANADADSKLVKRIKVEEEEAGEAGTSNQKIQDAPVSGESSQRSQCLTCSVILPMPELLEIHQLKHGNESLPNSAVIGTEENAIQGNSEDKNGGDASFGNVPSPSFAEGLSPATLSKSDVADTLLPYNKKCPFCKVVFDTDDALLLHVDDHGSVHPNSSKPFKCDYCYKSFTRRFRLEAHKSVHSNEVDRPFRCNLCLRKFCSNSALTAHIRFHVGCKGFDCPICREGFFSVNGLKAHVSSHCIDGEYKCPKCSKVFPTYSKIRRHIRSYHAVLPHVCTNCGKEMPSVDKLKIHMLSHSDRRDFLCPDCGKSFKRKDKLREHAKRMHSAEREDRNAKARKGPPKFVPKVDPADYKLFLYKCTICMLGFKRRGMLVNHLAKRHPNVDMKCVPELNQPILKATRCYKCLHCDKRYRSSSKRKLHILKYHPGAELPPKAANSASENETGPSYVSSYPHPCNWCYRQYASRARLLRHQRHHHPTHFKNEADPDAANDVAFLEAPVGISGELSLNGQIVTDGNVLRNHRLVNIARGGPDTAEGEGNEDDLLTQAMGEISPLAARQVLVSGEGGPSGPTLALVTDGPDTVTLSLPNGQLISLIPGLTVTGAPASVSSTSRAARVGRGNSADEVVSREDGPSVRMTYALGSTGGESSSEAEAVKQVVLAAQQPSSPSSQVVWQHALAFSNPSS